MPYRDEKRCHLCGEKTLDTCPCCGNPVCFEHTLARRVEGASAEEREEAERLARRVGGIDACQSCVEHELEVSQGPFVEIMRTSAPLETQMIVEALLDAGFDARAIGTQNAAILGAGQNIFEQRIEVPEPQAGEAIALIADLEHEEEESAGTDDEDERKNDRLSPRRRGVAAGLAIIFPGASHFYTRHPWTGLFLTVALFCGFSALASGAMATGVVLIGGATLADLIGGQIAVTVVNRGQLLSMPMQLLRGVVMGGGLLLLAWLAGRVIQA